MHTERGQYPARGFTLIEAMMALAIASILAMLGAPVFDKVLASARVSTVEGTLATTLQQARNAAVMHNRRVVACPSADGHHCAESDEWQRGWIVAADADHDGQPDAGHPILAAHPALSSRVRVVTSAGRRLVAFHPNGSAAGSNARFTICHAHARTGTSVVVSNAGRVRVESADPAHLQACLAGLEE